MPPCRDFMKSVSCTNFAAFSRESLNRFCGNKEFASHILTLARWHIC